MLGNTRKHSSIIPGALPARRATRPGSRVGRYYFWKSRANDGIPGWGSPGIKSSDSRASNASNAGQQRWLLLGRGRTGEPWHTHCLAASYQYRHNPPHTVAYPWHTVYCECTPTPLINSFLASHRPSWTESARCATSSRPSFLSFSSFSFFPFSLFFFIFSRFTRPVPCRFPT